MASAEPADPRISAFRRIVATGQLGAVDGVPVDLFSAAHVVGIYEQLSPEARVVFRRMSVERMIEVAYDSRRRELRSRGRRQ
jgi:hypothetical protein